MAEADVAAVMGPSVPAVDVGRVVVAAMFSLSTLSAVGRVWVMVTGAVSAGPLGPVGAAGTVGAGGAGELSLRTGLDVVCSVLTSVFCGLVVVAYLRRGAASATDRGPAVRLVAPVATCLPLVIPALPVHGGGTGRSLLAVILVGVGTAWCVWAVRHLSTCLSVVPQARGLVDSGPYRLVRHPLYLGEIVAVTGFAVRGGHWSHALVVVGLLALQLHRAGREEALLGVAVPGYAEYAARTWRILPGLA
jgi:protein-S-isoprenylcysteine O-methyltransferase Ste14